MARTTGPQDGFRLTIGYAAFNQSSKDIDPAVADRIAAMHDFATNMTTWYHHEMTERLTWKPTASAELKLHAARNGFYAVIFPVLARAEPHGLLLIETAIALTGFVIEDRTRLLPATTSGDASTRWRRCPSATPSSRARSARWARSRSWQANGFGPSACVMRAEEALRASTAAQKSAGFKCAPARI